MAVTLLTSSYSDEDYEISAGLAPSGDIRERDLSRPEPRFRNREREVDDVIEGVTEDRRTRFWLVIAPPQLGKSWFLDRVGNEVGKGSWNVRLLDVRALDPAAPMGSDELLRIIFETEARLSRPIDTGQIAGALLARERKLLLLIDSAELLDRACIESLRKQLGEINKYIEDARSIRTRLAVVVASRDDRAWLGAGSGQMLRLKALPLSELKVPVVFEILRDLAQELGHGYSETELQAYADRVHGLSEGLPALLRDYIQWIRESRFVHFDRLSERGYFDQLAVPYVRRELLSTGSLLGHGQNGADPAVLAALKQATRLLSPYRLITRSHVSHCQKAGALSPALEDAGLSVDQLWQALVGMALLCRPNDEPWKALHAPIRRLLYRHWYPTEAEQAKAQAQACELLESFDDLSGRDQADFLIERLWHETQSLWLSHSPSFAADLVSLAASLSASVRSKQPYSEDDLRGYMINRLEQDDEIMKAVEGYDGLFERLVEAVRNPRLGAGS